MPWPCLGSYDLPNLTKNSLRFSVILTGCPSNLFSPVSKAMRKSENSVIPCSAEIDLTGIPTVGNVTEINLTSETQKFRRNFNGNA